MFQNACRGVARPILSAAIALALALPALAQTRKVVLPEFATVKGAAILSGPEGPSLTQIAARLPAPTRLAPLSPEARGLVRLAALGTSAAKRLPGIEPGALSGLAPADLPRAMQEELKRIGCYSGGVDGDWGNGSRRAMERYYAAKKAEKGEVEPTEAAWSMLKAEAPGVCKPEPVAAKKKETTKKTATKKSTTTTKKSTTTTTKKPSGGTTGSKQPSCKFIGIAIICS